MKRWAKITMRFITLILIVIGCHVIYHDGAKKDYEKGFQDCLTQDSIVIVYDTIITNSAKKVLPFPKSKLEVK